MVFVFLTNLAFAQFQLIVEDDMEWTPGDCPPHWTGWGPGFCIPISTAYALSGTQSGHIPNDGTTDAILDLGNQIFGLYYQNFWMYIPSNQEAYWNLQGILPVGSGEWIMGNFFFNKDGIDPGVGLIDDCPGAPVNFTFPHDEWFEVFWEFDFSLGISTATCHLQIDGNQVLPEGTPFTSADGTVPTSLGGIDFFSISANNNCYLDNFGMSGLGINEFGQLAFHLAPNPVNEKLQILSNEDIQEIRVINYLGQEIEVYYNTKEVDVSKLSSGIYFIEVINNGMKGVERFIKN